MLGDSRQHTIASAYWATDDIDHIAFSDKKIAESMQRTQGYIRTLRDASEILELLLAQARQEREKYQREYADRKQFDEFWKSVDEVERSESTPLSSNPHFLTILGEKRKWEESIDGRKSIGVLQGKFQRSEERVNGLTEGLSLAQDLLQDCLKVEKDEAELKKEIADVEARWKQELRQAMNRFKVKRGFFSADDVSLKTVGL